MSTTKPAFQTDSATGINAHTDDNWNHKSKEYPGNKDERPVRRFRLLHGVHVQRNPHNGIEQGFRTVPGQPGPVIESREDLAARWPEKFGPVDAGQQSALPSDLMPLPGEDLATWHQRVGRTILENKSVTSHPDAVIGTDQGINNAQVTAQHAQQGGPQPTTPNVPVASDVESTLRSMNVEGLKKWAADNEIPVGTAKSKDELVKAILANR